MSYQDEANERERLELEKRSHHAQINQERLLAGGLAALALQTHLQGIRHQEALAEERLQTIKLDEQTSILRHKARVEEQQIAFTRDIQWLERSDAKGRFEYLLEKCDPVSALGQYVIQRSGFDDLRLDDSLLSAMSVALSLHQTYRKQLSKHDQMSQDLDIASHQTERSRFAGEKFSATGAVWAIASVALMFVAVAVMDSVESIAIILALTGVICFVVCLCVQSKFGAKQRKEVATKLAQLPRLLTSTKQDLEELLHKGKQAFAEANLLCDQWVRGRVRAAVDVVASDESFSLGLKDLIQRAERNYPPMLRIDWSQIGDDFLENRAQELLEPIFENLVERCNGSSEFFYKRLNAMGETKVAEQLKAYTSIIDKWPRVRTK